MWIKKNIIYNMNALKLLKSYWWILLLLLIGGFIVLHSSQKQDVCWFGNCDFVNHVDINKKSK